MGPVRNTSMEVGTLLSEVIDTLFTSILNRSLVSRLVSSEMSLSKLNGAVRSLLFVGRVRGRTLLLKFYQTSRTGRSVTQTFGDTLRRTFPYLRSPLLLDLLQK